MSKVLIHSLVFNPDGVSTAYLYNDIATKLKVSGFDVVVYTTTPHYNYQKGNYGNNLFKKKCLGLFYVSDYKGIPVNHINQKKYKSTFKRLLGFVFFHIMSFFLILFEKNVKVILSPSPPLTLGFLNIILGKLKGAKVIYNVQEIYPDLLISNGGLKSNTLIKLLKRMESFVYNFSNAVTTIDNIFYKTIMTRFKDRSKLSIIPNFVDTELYKPIDIESNDLSDTDFPNTDDVKLMYAGNIGLAQEWDTLIRLAIELKDEKFSFFVIGDGALKEKIIKAKIDHKLNKLHILPYQERKKIPKLLAYSDIQFIFMNPRLDAHGFPSKVYTIMACGKPMLIASSPNTPIVNFLIDKNCSFISNETDSSKRAQDFARFLRKSSKRDLQEIGERGVEVVKQSYSKEVVTSQYVNLVNKLLE